MKINLGTKGSIVGTKKVSASGTVQGLKHLAGEEVLIVKAPKMPVFEHTLRDHAAKARDAAAERARKLMKEAKAMSKSLPMARKAKNGKATKADKVLDSPLLVKADAWLRSQREHIVDAADDIIHGIEKRAKLVESQAKDLRDKIEKRVRAIVPKAA